MKKLGFSALLYLVGFGGAILVGLLQGFGIMPTWAWVPVMFIVAGLLIGYLNVKANEAIPVMVASLVIGAGSAVVANLPYVGTVLASIMSQIAFLSIPVGVVVGVVVFKDKLR